MRSAPMLVLAMPFGGAPALVQGGAAVPDLRGTGRGDSDAVAAGAANHYTAEGAGGGGGRQQQPQPTSRSVPLAIEVDRQEGRRFAGRVSSPNASERINGRHAPPRGRGRLPRRAPPGPGPLESCYRRITPQARIAGWAVLKRQR